MHPPVNTLLEEARMGAEVVVPAVLQYEPAVRVEDPGFKHFVRNGL